MIINWEKYKQNNWKTKEHGYLKILCIDGGGMKGIIPSLYLKNVEDKIGEPIQEHFDLLIGTSTGGIICLGLSAGLTAEEIASLYIEEGNKIFGRKRLGRGFLLKSAYNNQALKTILREKFSEIKMKDANTMLCIPSIEHHKASPKVFKTPHHQDYIIDGDKYMWEVGLATSAAPYYFPAANLRDTECKVDGGLWANNPVLVAVAEAKKLGFDLDKVKVLSIGTGETIYSTKNNRALSGGLFSWRKSLVEFTMQAQSKSAHHTAKYLIKENLTRINPILSQQIKMDTTKENDIKLMISETNRVFEHTFINNKVKADFFSKVSQVKSPSNL